MLFIALVWPHLFGNVVWAPRFQKDTADRGCPKTCNNFPGLRDLNYNERIKCPDLPNMKYRKERGDGIVRHGYKYTHGPYSPDKGF